MGGRGKVRGVGGRKTYFGLFFMKTLKVNKNVDDVSIFEDMESFDNFSGFCRS